MRDIWVAMLTGRDFGFVRGETTLSEAHDDAHECVQNDANKTSRRIAPRGGGAAAAAGRAM